MTGFVLHPEALTDISEIWEYIGADNPTAADKVVEEIYSTIKLLVAFPHQGHARADLTSRPIRFQTVRDYVIAYVPDAKPLAVIAALHGRRSPRVISAILQGRT